MRGSGPAPWRRFFFWAVGTAISLGAFVYLFTVIVDPWGMLPLSPPLPRVPISTNARYSFPALAREQRFDSAILGTSTSRLLRPALLDRLFDARFVNLAMNAATAYEQTRLLGVFARAHPAPRVVMIGLDVSWCDPGPYPLFTARPFPEWMYGRDQWRGYLNMFSLYAVQEAVNQFGVMVGLKKRRYGLDGYTVFTPPDNEYDAARAAWHIAREGGPVDFAEANRPIAALDFAALRMLHKAVTALPATTRKVLFFVPYYVRKQGQPGSRTQQVWAACKRHVAEIAGVTPNTVVADFMVSSAITNDPTHYWDPLHYRVGIADRLAHDLAQAANTGAIAAGDGRVLWPETAQVR